MVSKGYDFLHYNMTLPFGVGLDKVCLTLRIKGVGYQMTFNENNSIHQWSSFYSRQLGIGEFNLNYDRRGLPCRYEPLR